MTRAEAINYLTSTGLTEEQVMEVVEALEQEPCGDAISRQAVLEVIRNCHCEEWIKADIGAPIEELPSVNPQPKTGHWISVSERLPEKNMACLVAVGRFNLTQMAMYSDLMQTIDHRIFYQGDVGYDSFEDIMEYVKAWMPLPAPYKPQERSNKE